MDKTLHFKHFPTIEVLCSAVGDLPPPFSIEISQKVMKTHAGRSFPVSFYHEIIDCDTVQDLHDFLCDEETGLPDGGPFTIVIGPADEEDDFGDHPSLTASERNPSLR